MAGASAAAAASDSATTGCRRLRRTAWASTAEPASAAPIPVPSIGSRASGSRRRTTGSSQAASAMRATPRRSGVRATASGMSGLRPDAIRISPSSVRTAAAQCSRLCTMMPFRRAMPPSA